MIYYSVSGFDRWETFVFRYSLSDGRIRHDVENGPGVSFRSMRSPLPDADMLMALPSKEYQGRYKNDGRAAERA